MDGLFRTDGLVAVGSPDPWAGHETGEGTSDAIPDRFVPGGSFVLDVPDTPAAVWGAGGDVLWAEGEALMIAAPQGVGKTTLAFQLVRARLGLQDGVLGLPVAPGVGRTLYLAMDRPAQAQRAARRLFAGDNRLILNEKLVIWEGPPPYDLAKRPGVLAAMCARVKADTVVLDSLKDAAIKLSDDEVGAAYNRARQVAITKGIQVLELHHTRKAGTGGGEPNTIDDVYGSTWLTSGTGSVISLFGNPGDPIVSFRHLKQPMNEVGPWTLMHDHQTGRTTVQDAVDLVALVRAAGAEGLTATDGAKAVFGTSKPTKAEAGKAERRLDGLVKAGLLTKLPGQRGGAAATWHRAVG